MDKIYYLDGIRGLAAVGVMLIHFIVAFYPALFTGDLSQSHFASGIDAEIARSWWSILLPGNLAVPLFFVLSAYVLSFRFFSGSSSAVATAGAYRRYFRLVIPVTVSMLLSWALIHWQLNSHISVATITHSEGILGACFQQEASFKEAIYESLWSCFTVGGAVSYNPVLWTMNFELLASYLVFAFLGLFGRSPGRWLVYGVLLIVFIKSYFFAFVLGLLFSDMYYSAWCRPIKAFLTSRQWITWLLIVCGMFIGGYYDDNRNALSSLLNVSYLKTLGVDLYAFYHVSGAALVFFGCLYNSWLKCLLSCRLCRFLGRISFPLYLVHFLLITSLGSCLFLAFIERGWSYHVSVAISAVITLVVILGVAYYMAKYIDEPAMRLVRRLQQRYFN